MKKAITLIMLAVALLLGAANADARSNAGKGYKIEKGQIIPTTNKPVIVDFYADWCGPCKMFAPIFEEAQKRYGSKAIFIRIDVDQEEDVARRYHIQSIPTTMVVLDKGNDHRKAVGYMNEERLMEFISPFLK